VDGTLIFAICLDADSADYQERVFTYTLLAKYTHMCVHILV